MSRTAEAVSGNDPLPKKFVTPGTMQVVAKDAEEFGEQVSDWSIELKQLQPGAFGARVILVPLGPALVAAGCYEQSMLQHVGVPEGCLNITRPGRGSLPTSLQGHEVGAGEVYVAGAGADCESMNSGLHFPTGFSVKTDYLQTQADWLNAPHLLSCKGVRLHSPGIQWAENYLDTVEWIMSAVKQYPDATSGEAVRGSLLDTLLSRMNTLAAADSPLSNDREQRSARRVAVGRAREYIAANLADPIRLSDLCKYARAQARSLEYGFHEVVGVSPIAYIRATRLHRARKLLRSTAVRTKSISEIALDCGFWHLSQFSVDYKRLFAESPSITYRRTQSQLPRAERRSLHATPAVPRNPSAMARA